jgi:uncharacterized protein YgiM (DUF1202 family)
MKPQYTSYGNYSKPNTKTPVEEIPVATEEKVSDNTDTPLPVIAPEPVTDPISEVPRLYGYVDNCQLLNVRKSPTKIAEVVSKLPRGTEVLIDESLSDNTFYKILTKPGDEGFCMREYITLRS